MENYDQVSNSSAGKLVDHEAIETLSAQIRELSAALSNQNVGVNVSRDLEKIELRIEDLIEAFVSLQSDSSQMRQSVDSLEKKLQNLEYVLLAQSKKKQNPAIDLKNIDRFRLSKIKSGSADAFHASRGVYRMSQRGAWRHSVSLSRLAKNLSSNLLAANSAADGKKLIYSVKSIHPLQAHRRRVMHAIPNVFMGGSTQLIVDLVTHLGHKYNMHLMTSAFPTNGKHDGLIIHDFSPGHASVQSMLDLFGKFEPEIIHVHYWGDIDTWWYDLVFQAAQRFGVPIIQNINTPVQPYSAQTEVVYVSDYVRKTFPSSSGHEHENVIYPGIDLSKFQDTSISSDALDSIGMVYRLEHDKLNVEAIDPFIEVVRMRPRTRAVIVGGGSLYEPFRNKVEAAGLMDNFWFTGYVPYDALPELYKQFSIFVAPVWKESFGQVAPFAMNMGRAVAGYDIGALSEILGDKSCLASNAQDLANLLKNLLDNPDKIQSIGRRNCEISRKKYGVTKMTNSYDRLYEKILGVEVSDQLAAFPPAELYPID